MKNNILLSFLLMLYSGSFILNGRGGLNVVVDGAHISNDEKESLYDAMGYNKTTNELGLLSLNLTGEEVKSLSVVPTRIIGVQSFSDKQAVLADEVESSDLVCVLEVEDHGVVKVGGAHQSPFYP